MPNGNKLFVFDVYQELISMIKEDATKLVLIVKITICSMEPARAVMEASS